MNGYNFTERVRRVLAQAREEADALGHRYVGCEHELLGLLASGGVATTVLENLGVELSRLAEVVKQTLKPGVSDDRWNAADLPYTAGAKKVLEYAMNEARELNHSYVGTEHLLLGLLREKKGNAARVLSSFGVTLEKARAETLRILGVEISGPLSPPTGERPRLVHITLTYSNGAVVGRDFMDTVDAARFLSDQ